MLKKYEFLKTMGGERLENVFKPEIGFGLLGDFGHCLCCEYKDADFETVTDMLEHLSKTNRFTLTVQFLSSKEKEDMNNLFVKFKQSLGDRDGAVLESLQKTYDVKL